MGTATAAGCEAGLRPPVYLKTDGPAPVRAKPVSGPLSSSRVRRFIALHGGKPKSRGKPFDFWGKQERLGRVSSCAQRLHVL